MLDPNLGIIPTVDVVVVAVLRFRLVTVVREILVVLLVALKSRSRAGLELLELLTEEAAGEIKGVGL